MVGILIGTLLFDERLSRPAWHVVVAVVGLCVALVGAVAISLAREAERRRGTRRRRTGRVRREGIRGGTRMTTVAYSSVSWRTPAARS